MFQYTKVSPFLGIVLGISSLSATRMTSAEFFDFGLSGISLSPGPRVAGANYNRLFRTFASYF